MKSKADFEQLKKLEIKDLIKQRKGLDADLVKEKSVTMSASGKSGNNVKIIRRKIAWIETLISQKLAIVNEQTGE